MVQMQLNLNGVTLSIFQKHGKNLKSFGSELQIL